MFNRLDIRQISSALEFHCRFDWSNYSNRLARRDISYTSYVCLDWFARGHCCLGLRPIRPILWLGNGSVIVLSFQSGDPGYVRCLRVHFIGEVVEAVFGVERPLGLDSRVGGLLCFGSNAAGDVQYLAELYLFYPYLSSAYF